jgi:hypothetical protein
VTTLLNAIADLAVRLLKRALRTNPPPGAAELKPITKANAYGNSKDKPS